MMRGFIESAFEGKVEATLDFYTSAIEVLKWGAEFWKDVPYREKGNIFQPTFMRGVKCLRLDALLGVSFICSVGSVCAHTRRNRLQACVENPGKFSHEELLTSADELLFELANAPTQPHVPDAAFFLSFFRYPVGQAHA
jgi:hypothetical protein